MLHHHARLREGGSGEELVTGRRTGVRWRPRAGSHSGRELRGFTEQMGGCHADGARYCTKEASIVRFELSVFHVARPFVQYCTTELPCSDTISCSRRPETPV